MTTSTIWLDLLGAEVRYRGAKFRTRTIEAGSGEPLILIHGNGGHAEAWAKNVLRLADKRHVVAIDLVWHGLSGQPPFTVDMVPTYTEQLVELIDDLGGGPVAIEGESLGGWVALWTALHHPDKVSKLVLNTTAGIDLRPPDAPRPDGAGLRERSIAAIQNPTDETVRARLEWLMARPERVTDELVALRKYYYTRPETRASLTQVFENSFGKHDTYVVRADQLQQLTVPTLVVWTEHNPGQGPDVGKQIADAIPGAEFEVIADAGHWPQWEQPETHDRLLLDFLER